MKVSIKYQSKPTVQFFVRDLQQKLQTVRSYADKHDSEAQQRRVSCYNLRAKEKQFLGQLVLVGVICWSCNENCCIATRSMQHSNG